MRGWTAPCPICTLMADVHEERSGIFYHVNGVCPAGHITDAYGVAEPRREVTL